LGFSEWLSAAKTAFGDSCVPEIAQVAVQDVAEDGCGVALERAA